MGSVQPWMRLKVNGDTFFLPDADGRVYFRNNAGSFHMEGAGVQSWIEKLLPAFDGQTTLEDLTDGLPAPYQDRIREIASILYDNGFVRDVSADPPHQLPDAIVNYYLPQIEFIDNLMGGGGARFEVYRRSKVLVVGAGQILLSAVLALFESGVQVVHVLNTSSHGTDQTQWNEICGQYQQLDPGVRVVAETLSSADGSTSLATAVARMNAVVYVSQSDTIDELLEIERLCRTAQCLFLPAVCVKGVGLVYRTPTGKADENDSSHGRPAPGFDAAWGRLHSSVFEQRLGICNDSDVAGAVLVNVSVLELFKTMTGIVDGASSPAVYTLNLETLEGTWHSFIPAPSVARIGFSPKVLNPKVLNPKAITALDESSPAPSPEDSTSPEPSASTRVAELSANNRTTEHSTESQVAALLSHFAELTETTTGIFHVWDEGDLPQLPLSECRVQPIDALSAGPASLLGEIVCVGMTHEDARVEAGLTGIEAYVRRLTGATQSIGDELGFGVGSTTQQALGRALVDCLNQRLQREAEHHPPRLKRVHLGQIDDEECRYYLKALTASSGTPNVAFTEDDSGFPVIFVETKGHWIGDVGFSIEMALQHALQGALLFETQDDLVRGDVIRLHSQLVCFDDKVQEPTIDIGSCSEITMKQVSDALKRVERCGKAVTVFDLAIEPFLVDKFAGVFGVAIREEGLQ